MTKRDLTEAFNSVLPVMNDTETIEMTLLILKIIKRATLSGELELVDDEPIK